VPRITEKKPLKTILRSCKDLDLEKNDKTNLNYIDIIEKWMQLVEYHAYSFGHAMQNGILQK
jgi:hypothetical protein